MLQHTVVRLTRQPMAKGQSKERKEQEEFKNANQELIDRALRVQHTMATPGWQDIMGVINAEMEKIANAIDVCPIDQVDPFRKSRIALRLVVTGFQALIDEGKNAQANMNHEPDTY